MLKHIRVIPLAAESLGTRSMCTYVETPEVRLLLDAGVSLCPDRFGLSPHPQEFRAIIESRKRIVEFAARAEVVTVSHYHFDHHTPSFEDWLCHWTAYKETAKEIYFGKTVLMKSRSEAINFSQRRRGWMFEITGGKSAKKLEIADNRAFAFGKYTEVRFSEPVFHGADQSPLGWVLMTTIRFQDESFLFAPDVQGPMSQHSLNLILATRPNLVVIGGPPTYLSEFRINPAQLQTGLKNLEKIVETAPCTILEHHILRDEKWREKTIEIFAKASKIGHTVMTAAEYLGRENKFLEATRKILYAEDKPQRDFEKWMKQDIETRKRTKPPV